MPCVYRSRLVTGLTLVACVVNAACEQGQEPAPRTPAKQEPVVSRVSMKPRRAPSLQEAPPSRPGQPRGVARSSARPLPPDAVAMQVRDAFLNKRFHEIWERMSKSAQDRFVRGLPEARPSKPIGAGELFARYWQEQFEASPNTREEIRASRIAGVKVTGAVATVTVRDRDGHDQHMELILEEGVWKLNRMPD